MAGRACAVLLLVAIHAANAASAAGSPIVRVEEDWELVVKSPDPNSSAPQVTMVISPSEHVDGLHAAFELNHQSLPQFEAGGLQLQTWDGETHLSSQKFPNAGIMSQDDEVVRWTQVVRVTNNGLIFEVIDGTSTTWGKFGGQGKLRSQVATPIDNLNGYDPQVSIDHSGVAFAGNRVTSLVLKRVRTIRQDGTVVEDDSPREVQLPQ